MGKFSWQDLIIKTCHSLRWGIQKAGKAESSGQDWGSQLGFYAHLKYAFMVGFGPYLCGVTKKILGGCHMLSNLSEMFV